MKYFEKCATIEELKKAYKIAIVKNHPDNGGDPEVMKAINVEYEAAFSRLKKADHRGTEPSSEMPKDFIDIIDALINLAGVKIEIIGCFIWVSGNTYAHRSALKGLGFRWHSKKKMWYMAPDGYVKKSKKELTIDEIRGLYGVKGTYAGASTSQVRASIGAC